MGMIKENRFSHCPVIGLNTSWSSRMKVRGQRGTMMTSHSSTGSFCLLEGSMEEACPMEEEERYSSTNNNLFCPCLMCFYAQHENKC